MTYALRGARAAAAHALAAPIARAIAQMALAALGLSGDPVHELVHARDPASPEQVFLFTRDFAVDWTNNVSERGAKAASAPSDVSGSRYAGGSAGVLPEPAAGGSVTPGTCQDRLSPHP